MNFLREKLVMLRMACTVDTNKPFRQGRIIKPNFLIKLIFFFILTGAIRNFTTHLLAPA